MVPEAHSVVVEGSKHLWIEVETEDWVQDKAEAHCSFAMEVTTAAAAAAVVVAVVRAGHVALSMRFLSWRIE
jgi:hypothetical protein